MPADTHKPPKQNRVDPFGRIRAVPERGTLMGNRGVLHDEQQRVRRVSASKAWITCLLDYKGRKRELMSPGKYTELFFLDEATALAAGHRPCAECRRTDYVRYVDCLLKGNPDLFGPNRPTAPAIDDALQRARSPLREDSRPLSLTVSELDDGGMCTDSRHPAIPLLRRMGLLYPWSFAGYRTPINLFDTDDVRLLTPLPTFNAIRSGYAPGIHPSAVTPGPAAKLDPEPFLPGDDPDFAHELDWQSRMWLRPNRNLVGYRTNYPYALTIGGVGYATDCWGFDLYSEAGRRKIESLQAADGTWRGSFQDLRAALYFMQRSIRWAEGSGPVADQHREYDRLYGAVCDAWDREHAENSARVAVAHATDAWLTTRDRTEPAEETRR